MATLIPPWLSDSSNPGQLYITALNAGANVAAERNRLALTAQQAAMEYATKQQQLEVEAQKNKAQLDQTAAYQNQVLSLRGAQLDQAGEKIAATAQSAAQKFQAQQAMQGEIQRLIDEEDMSPEEAYAQATLTMGQTAGLPGSAYSTAGRIYKTSQDESIGNPNLVPAVDNAGATVPGWMRDTSNGRLVKAGATPGSVDQQTRLQVQQLNRQEAALQKQLESAPPRTAANAAQWDAMFGKSSEALSEIQDKITALVGSGSKRAGTSTNSFRVGRFNVTPQ